MPLINGQKMACEPCIRGHRSTKCNHAHDRLMVPVRKPGRPLSSCPHPASRPCSCTAVTAAIPKKQTCHCGPAPSQPPPADKFQTESELNSSSLPTSPTRSTPGAPFRVQKQTSKSASRKQSVDIAGLDRMDVNQLNIIQGFDATHQTAANGANGMNPYAAMGINMAFSPPGAMYPMLQPPMTQPYILNGKGNANGPSSNGTTEPGSGGCCGSKRASNDATAEATKCSDDSKPEAVGSCCSSKANGTSTPTQAASEKTNGHVNGSAMPMFQPPMAMPNDMYPFFATPNIFTYPPQYGSYLQPLQPKQWRQVMSTMNMAPQVQQAYMFGGQPSVPYQQNDPVNYATWTTHQCSCGDTCQCVGCATHPYNEATQTYVRSAWNVMMQDAQNGHTHANETHSPTNGNHDAPNGHLPQDYGKTAAAAATTTTTTTTTTKTEPTAATAAVAGAVSKTEGSGAISPAAPQTPSDATSGLAAEQALSANDFFFVSYPFTDGCEGEMANCPCGDDCQCIGCAIHSNPAPDPVEPN